MVKILLAEDDKDLNALIRARLTQEGYEAIPCADGQEAWETLENCAADLVITDIMMPRMDGFALAGRIRETDKKLPILFLTALDDKPSKQRGFALGIDDYVAKPFDTDLLMLRVAALLRRANIERTRELTAGNLRMNSEEHTAYLDGEELPLTVREFDILFKLLSFPKRLLSNAVKFTEQGGITLSLKMRDGNAVVRVADTGQGISPEVGRHIFEKFYQGDTSHAGEGNGLGLALVKKVIDLLGGEIAVESEAGKGSTFTVTLRGVT